jgi:AraC family transcriptional regulator
VLRSVIDRVRIRGRRMHLLNKAVIVCRIERGRAGKVVAKVTKDGRIVLWEGGSLWAFDVLPARDRPNRMHSHHAFQLTLAAGGEVSIRTAQDLLPGPVILVAPDVPHSIEPEGRIALIFVEPESRAGSGLAALLQGQQTARLPDIPRREDHLASIWARPAADNAAIERLGRRLLDLMLGDAWNGQLVNPRIGRVLDWLNQDGRETASVAEAANIACLSESRFSHVFVEQVGLPFRTFLLWRRLVRAVEYLATGRSATEAAHAAGFADSAHFSRTFQRMFGLPAAALELAQREE